MLVDPLKVVAAGSYFADLQYWWVLENHQIWAHNSKSTMSYQTVGVDWESALQPNKNDIWWFSFCPSQTDSDHLELEHWAQIWWAVFFQKCKYHSIFVCCLNMSSWHYLGTELASPEVWYIIKWSWYLFCEKSAVFEAWTNVWAPIWRGHIGQKIF